MLFKSFLLLSTIFLEGRADSSHKSFLSVKEEYFDVDGNPLDNFFYVTNNIETKLRDLNQFEEDMDKETDLLYIMGDIRTEQDIENAIDSFTGIYEEIDYDDPNYQEIVIVPVDQTLDDAVDIKFDDYRKDLEDGVDPGEVFD